MGKPISIRSLLGYVHSARRTQKTDEGGSIHSLFDTIEFTLKCAGSTARTWCLCLGNHHIIHADEHDCGL